MLFSHAGDILFSFSIALTPYTRSGRRILVADSRLQNLGYNYLRLYYGSFRDWKNNGGKII